MPDQEAKPPVPAEENGATDPQPSADNNRSSSDRLSWASQDPLSNIANVLTVVLALVAIGLSIWEGYQTRRYNRLSVLPNLEANEMAIPVFFADPITGEYYPFLQNEDSLYAVSYSLENTGLGPAVIQNVVAFRKGEQVFDASQSDISYWNKLKMGDEFNQIPFGASYRYEVYEPGEMLEAGEIYGFMTVAIPSVSPANVDSLDRHPTDIVEDALFETRSFVFCYCSVYGTDCGMTSLGTEPPAENVCSF